MDEKTGRWILDWYSSMIWFYGSFTIQVIALDDNYHHYVYANNKELTSGVTGGIGVFGSLTGESYKLEILRE